MILKCQPKQWGCKFCTTREWTKESVKNNKFGFALDSRKMVLIGWVLRKNLSQTMMHMGIVFGVMMVLQM
jgi:hypothetical protein